MLPTRNGKIARLPLALRREINHRLDEGEPGTQIVAWLNSLPEVHAFSAAEWDGKPIREQNLSQWRQGGYREWIDRQEAREIALSLREDAEAASVEDEGQGEKEGQPPLSDLFSQWLTARYMLATRRIATAPEDKSWRLLREFARDLVRLRESELRAERLRLERERFEWDKEREFELTEKDHWEWAMREENRERICRGYCTPAERMARMRVVMFGGTPDRRDYHPHPHPPAAGGGVDPPGAAGPSAPPPPPPSPRDSRVRPSSPPPPPSRPSPPFTPHPGLDPDEGLFPPLPPVRLDVNGNTITDPSTREAPPGNPH